MKSKYFLMSFLAVSMLAFGATAHAATYSLGVTQGSTYRLTLLEANTNYWSPNTPNGMSVTLQVTSITERVAEWVVTLKEDWTNTEIEARVYRQKDTRALTDGLWLISIPGHTYLSELSGSLGSQYKVDGTTVTKTETINGVTRITEQGYDANSGWISLYRVTENGVKVFEMLGSAGIPGYEVPILLGITGLFTMGLIILQKRRM